MSLFKNKYRIEPARLERWCYSWQGDYFVTICTNKQRCYFGGITDNVMHLSELGKIAQQYWRAIPEHFPFVKLDEFVTMPNHIHGIITVGHRVETQDVASQEKSGSAGAAKCCNSTSNTMGVFNTQFQNIASQNNKGAAKSCDSTSETKGVFKPQSKNIASIIRGYKAGVKKYATISSIGFCWQSLFYDRVIRNEQELERIRLYIE